MWIFIIGNRVEVIIDKARQYYLIEMNHAGIFTDGLEETAKLTGSHLGINKMADKVSSQFYWPGIKEDVTEHVKSCECCQKV